MASERVLAHGSIARIWIALLALLLLTAGSSGVEMGRYNVIVNLAIAIVQGLLVMIFYMDLRDRGGLVRLTAGAGFLFIAFLIALSLADYLTRIQAVPPF